MSDTGKVTGTSDNVYNLVSIYYHALQGSENYARYADDAERSGDSELAGFFREMQETDAKLGERIAGMLRDRLNQAG
jgi:rubrerythrin